jgi:hypothetical protein
MDLPEGLLNPCSGEDGFPSFSITAPKSDDLDAFLVGVAVEAWSSFAGKLDEKSSPSIVEF